MPRNEMSDRGDERAGALAAPVAVITTGDGSVHATSRNVAIETPVNVVYANVPFAVMMATPADLEDFAYGFSLTEGVIARPDDVRDLRVERQDGAIRLHLDLTPERLRNHLARRRALSGRTSCGVCGIEDLAALPRARQADGQAPAVSLTAIRRALDALEERQALQQATHAVHGAAWADREGAIRFVREDVGRHNALDKLIGALVRADIAPDEGFVVITSRCSYEMLEKTAAFGARTLVAISAPTSLALERARALDITLIASARRGSVAVYHGLDRIREDVTA
ncbi:formate dehydrogenase accessory sulfurtransferase FdhD [Marinivivus vitaminiproducens]|uniref:formate dehydrogenase accessory sulfurtransferase FdhD n=1 Tax=Marinivivus vitaminiproducens TaxID=3035935 RepID=UPI0027A0CE8B|nr:formate dehydrogenase accessory sulfurtransferase FdhD [Geminicoccaceae bacterium SCSIO 64248]